MKKTFAGLGVLALVALGMTGASFPANADTTQPVAEIVAESDAIVASPDAVLSQSEPTVTTTAAEVVEVPAEPVAVVEEPVVAPEPVAVPEVPEQVAETPVAAPVAPEQEPVTEPEPTIEETVETEPVDYWQTTEDPNAPRLWWNQGSTVEAFELYRIDFPEFTDAEQQGIFTEAYLGRYMVGYVPADSLLIPSVENPETVYAFKLR